MSALLAVDRLLVVVAHYDDEALFGGGVLLRLAARGTPIHVAVVTAVEETNAPESRPYDQERERRRQERRLAAFGRVCDELGATASHLGRSNLASDGSDAERAEALRRETSAALHGVLREQAPSAVLTHGEDGEYGHPQHRMTHRAVLEAWPGPTWCFVSSGGSRGGDSAALRDDPPPEETYRIDWPAKLALLRHYHRGTTQKPFWDPTAKPAYSPWCSGTESFRKMPPSASRSSANRPR